MPTRGSKWSGEDSIATTRDSFERGDSRRHEAAPKAAHAQSATAAENRTRSPARLRAQLECPMPFKTPQSSVRPAGLAALAALLPIVSLLAAPPAAASAPRVVVLGFDGADHALVKKMIDEGKLPNLAALAKKGGFSQLLPTIPGADAGLVVHVLDGPFARPHDDLRLPEAEPEDLPPRVRDRGRGEEGFSARKDE